MRGGFPVVLSQSTVEVHREEGRRLSVPTAQYENFAGPGRVSVMASVAISGAAVSPLMGRYAAQMAPYRFLLALFNARVGAWVRNPMHTTDQPQNPPQAPNFLWMTAKPGLWQVALEGVGNTSANFRWIYVSDGGHLDNTGLVECVRHCVEQNTGGRVLVPDASNDPIDTGLRSATPLPWCVPTSTSTSAGSSTTASRRGCAATKATDSTSWW
ncbi:hypothetical protein [Nocardioides sp. B-3]|uniref:hypothetical protein n=1 Tax=Nocardioides sp. B-3 TaxID=2895565 RepID=UPI0021534B52|nr:hypothetical protein [Nocardioides sp. B-3]UUZ59426.1 hypothetical protein LP418_27150 [Nocardioides sp. B-3]